MALFLNFLIALVSIFFYCIVNDRTLSLGLGNIIE